jgi:hypothetical protein
MKILSFQWDDLGNNSISWFLVIYNDEPSGVLRVMYDPPLHLYKEYQFQMMETGIDIDEFIRNNKIAEIGRFAVLPKYRNKIRIASSLMRAGTEDTIRRGFSHYITDVFEGEINSPYNFHTRMIGFQPIASHDVGELNCPNRRITLILDIKEAYNRMLKKNKSFYRFITKGWDEQLHKLLIAT